MNDEQKQSIDAQCSEKVEFLGVEIDPLQVQNPHLRRVLQKRMGPKFAFKYDDHSRREWSEYDEMNYADYREKYHEVAYKDHAEFHGGGMGVNGGFMFIR